MIDSSRAKKYQMNFLKKVLHLKMKRLEKDYYRMVLDLHRHPLIKAMIEHIVNTPVSIKDTSNQAWINTGPGLITKFIMDMKPDIKIFASHYFLPIHLSGLEYKGHGKIYA